MALCCFAAKTIEKAFFLTFTRAENIALKCSLEIFASRVISGTFFGPLPDGYKKIEAKCFKMQSISIIIIRYNQEQ